MSDEINALRAENERLTAERDRLRKALAEISISNGSDRQADIALVALSPEPTPGPYTYPKLLRCDRPWSEYPIGTKAHSVTGGAWTKTARGWKWGRLDGGGGVFPTPGGDACGACVELPTEPTPEQPAAEPEH